MDDSLSLVDTTSKAMTTSTEDANTNNNNIITNSDDDFKNKNNTYNNYNNNPDHNNVSNDEIVACQISSWYCIFSQLSKESMNDRCSIYRSNVTFRSIIIDLPDTFRDYLLTDGLFIPQGAQLSSILLQDNTDNNRQQQENDDTWSSSSSSSSLSSSSSTNSSCSRDNDEDYTGVDDCIQNDNNNDNDKTIDGDEVKARKMNQKSSKRNKPKINKVKVHTFPELNQQIEDAIETLYAKYNIIDSADKAVFPKLNWSAPKDAVWVNSGSMKCCTPGDIYMLLKASDFCSYDANYALPELQQHHQESSNSTITTSKIEGEMEYDKLGKVNNDDSTIMKKHHQKPKLQLCLRKWCYLNPSQEFRCFVKNKCLIAISQRHSTQHWAHLNDKSIQDEYVSLIQQFHKHIIQPNLQRHPIVVCLHHYVMDVYIDKKKNVWLVDLNVWSNRTDTLLFTWSELEQFPVLSTSSLQSNNTDTNTTIDDDNNDNIVLRVVETSKQVRADPLSSYRAPIDTLYVASSASSSKPSTSLHDDEADDNVPLFQSKGKFEQFMDLCKRPNTTTISSESDDDDDDDRSTCSSLE